MKKLILTTIAILGLSQNIAYGEFLRQNGPNLYAYVNNNPINYNDPSGNVCNAVGVSVKCQASQNAPSVEFPRPEGWPDVINEQSTFYHNYNVQVNAGNVSSSSLRQGIINAPTPGSPSPATRNGTVNDATPSRASRVFNTIDYISSFGNDAGGYNNSPVKSYIRSDSVVNVTLPGHPLFPGYVARTTTDTSSGTTVNNFGEGTGYLQSMYSPVASVINNVWVNQTQGIIDGIRANNASGGYVLYPSKVNMNLMRQVYTK